MIFDSDHWESYDEPSLELHAVTDAEGRTFLLLEGAEPDVSWERFIAAVRHLVDRLDVRLTIGVHGIPMGVPHTRPTAVTAHGTRPELTEGREPWVGRIQVPGSMINLLELRLGQSGHDAMGFAVHVPHYLAQAEYPGAAAALADQVAAAERPVDPDRRAAHGGRADPRPDRRAGGGVRRGGGGRAGPRAAVRRVRRRPRSGRPARRSGRRLPHGRRARCRARALPGRAAAQG